MPALELFRERHVTLIFINDCDHAKKTCSFTSLLMNTGCRYSTVSCKRTLAVAAAPWCDGVTRRAADDVRDGDGDDASHET
jgi:hypothetical protein